MILIEIHEGMIEKLLDCRTKKHGRDFRNWEVKSLMYEAIVQFHEKHGNK